MGDLRGCASFEGGAAPFAPSCSPSQHITTTQSDPSSSLRELARPCSGAKQVGSANLLDPILSKSSGVAHLPESFTCSTVGLRSAVSSLVPDLPASSSGLRDAAQQGSSPVMMEPPRSSSNLRTAALTSGTMTSAPPPQQADQQDSAAPSPLRPHNDASYGKAAAETVEATRRYRVQKDNIEDLDTEISSSPCKASSRKHWFMDIMICGRRCLRRWLCPCRSASSITHIHNFAGEEQYTQADLDLEKADKVFQHACSKDPCAGTTAAQSKKRDTALDAALAQAIIDAGQPPSQVSNGSSADTTRAPSDQSAAGTATSFATSSSVPNQVCPSPPASPVNLACNDRGDLSPDSSDVASAAIQQPLVESAEVLSTTAYTVHRADSGEAPADPAEVPSAAHRNAELGTAQAKDSRQSPDETEEPELSAPAVEVAETAAPQVSVGVSELERTVDMIMWRLREVTPPEQRHRVFIEQCRAWHPDKNGEDLRRATVAFQRLQSTRSWFLAKDEALAT